MAKQPTDSEIRELLTNYKKIAVIGLSPVPARPSYGVTRYMINHGYEVYGIRPGSPAEILGRPSFESLNQLEHDVDIIDVFRNSDAIPQVVDEIEKWMSSRPLEKRPKALWLQLGVAHPEAEEKAEKLGLKVISDRCILQEHARLLT